MTPMQANQSQPKAARQTGHSFAELNEAQRNQAIAIASKVGKPNCAGLQFLIVNGMVVDCVEPKASAATTARIDNLRQQGSCIYADINGGGNGNVITLAVIHESSAEEKFGKLFAASLEMLEALESVASSGPLNNGMRDENTLEIVRAAIAKATL